MAAGMVGADTEELRALGDRFAERAETADGGRSGTLTAVREVRWEGPDADAFRAAFEDRVAAALEALAERLECAADELDAQAQAQDEASLGHAAIAGLPGGPMFEHGGGSGGGSGGGGGGSWGGGAPQGPPGAPDPPDMDEVSDFTYDKVVEWIASDDYQAIYSTARQNPWLFNRVLNAAIRARSGDPGGIAEMALYALIAPDMCAAAYMLYDNMTTNSAWDLKPYLAEEYGQPLSEGPFDTSDADGNVTRSDAFGNVAYGMMLAHLGVDEETALRAANAGGDAGIGSDPLDDAAVRKGYEIYGDHPAGMTQEEFQQEMDDAQLPK
ncbi:hypothetical protein USB125703_00488 [Pseudoclavibacter triregionum]|nr:hypothetical protein USB125703_00488 [Pseudoclavibacter triregionum]